MCDMQVKHNSFIVHNNLVEICERLKGSGLTYAEKAEYINWKYLADSEQRVYPMTLQRYDKTTAPPTSDELKEFMQSTEFIKYIRKITKT